MTPTQPTEIHQLLYWSRATGAMLAAQVEDLVKASQRNNSTFGLTGFLLFDTSIFIQLLEGELAELETVWAKISGDTRHKDIKVFHRITTPHRNFSSWLMAYQLINAGRLEFYGGTAKRKMCREMAMDLQRKGDLTAQKMGQYLNKFLDNQDKAATKV